MQNVCAPIPQDKIYQEIRSYLGQRQESGKWSNLQIIEPHQAVALLKKNNIQIHLLFVFFPSFSESNEDSGLF